MAKSNKVLTVDITNESITIVEVTPSAKKGTTVHNALIFETPEDSYEDGNIKDTAKIAAAIKEQLSANGITNKNVIFILTSTKVVNREVLIPDVKENKVKGIVSANATEYFPVNIEDYVVSHSILDRVIGDNGAKQLKLMVVAAPITMVKGYYELGSVLGLNVQSIDYVGNAMLQLIKTQTSASTTTMVIQLGSESTILNIVKGDTLLLQRTVPYGTNAVVTEVMDEKGVDATTAMTLLQNDRLITVDFDDNAATGAFRHLINNIGRVIDYYVAKNPDKPIDDVYLVGDGALIRGIDGLFKIQLNIQTKVMDSLYSVKFDDKIDQRIFNPVYLVAAIGAAFAPMGFQPVEVKASKSGSTGYFKYWVAFAGVAVVLTAAGSALTIVMKNNEQQRKDSLNAQIAAIQDIEQIMNQYYASQAKYDDIMLMYDNTRSLNENFIMFIEAMEDCIPKEVMVKDYASSDDGIEIAASAASWDAIAKFDIELKKIPCIANTFVHDIDTINDEKTGEVVHEFNITCQFVSMVEEEQIGVDESADESGALTVE